jgi:hypothetical protein
MRHVLLSIWIACACGDGRPAGWDRPRQVLGPVPLKDAVAYVDDARDEVVLVDVSEPAPRVSTISVGRRPIFAAPTPDGLRLAVVTRGQEGVKEGEVDEAPGLYLVAVDVDGAAPIRYELESPFDRLAIAADGSVAVAYFSSGGPDSEGLFRNPNELAVVHLAEEPSATNPTFRTVRSFSTAPTGVVLSPPIAIPGAEDPSPRTLAWVFAPGTLTILDASHPDRSEVTIRLSEGGTVTPEEIVFAPQAGAAYLRASGARDVLAVLLSFEAPTGEDPRENDYQPALAELGAGGTPADVAVYDDIAGVRRVVAATPGTREVTVIDTDTAELRSIPTPDPIDRILLLPSDAPRVAVLASLANRVPRVHLLGLDAFGDELMPVNLRTVDLTEPVFDVVPVPSREMVMLVHDDARTVLGMLDVRTSTVAPIEGAGRLDAFDFTPGGDMLIGATRGVARIGFVTLDDLHPTDVRLDDVPAQVFAMASGRVYVDHGDPFGRASILESSEASRADALVLSGFLIADLFEEDDR